MTSSIARAAALTVAVLADDPLDGEGAEAYLLGSPGLGLLPLSQVADADVLLALTTTVSDSILDRMANVRACHGAVLVADAMTLDQLRRALDCGTLGVLRRRDAGLAAIVAEIAAVPGRSTRPANVRAAILDRHRASAARDEDDEEYRERREYEVLRLMASGLGNEEIATTLRYSSHTVKKIVREILARSRTRNRTHAVAIALRSGLLSTKDLTLTQRHN